MNYYGIIKQYLLTTKQFSNTGINRIHDLFDTDGKISNRELLSKEVGFNVDVMLYNSIISSLPQKLEE